MAGRRAVLLDRDGVLTEETGAYVTRPQDLRLLPGAAEAVVRLNRAGWAVAVVTNQAGVGKGILTLPELEAIHAQLQAAIARTGGHLDGIFLCPHHPDAGCDCRKPLPGLLWQAARALQLDLAACYLVGDSPRDIAAGHAAGCHTVLVLTGHTRHYRPETFPPPLPEQVFPALPDFVDTLLRT
ncbi:MAG: D-glycero-beta-D-manno-heptose 1,7-bisphosphate 7-phosphatase [Chloroherpetonaceae bacterium]|nr:D-glycero-beta-D-manno-heptose 1,7-bisphosphate 7-phosphatase [Chthonomonadaceae bacterium]MDW8206281.1 D-glycero-beta-D-manno-heptose 1,7-bisphosphate 7-phosphatase [Chloroherpetonaceae bacterium]